MAKAKIQVRGTEAETGKESGFTTVEQGICPDDGKSVGDDIAGRGEGVTRKNPACKRLWQYRTI